jgi:hypothetical protein
VDVGDTKVISRLPRAPIRQRDERVDLVFNLDRVLLYDETSKESLLRRDSQREKVSVR